MPRKEICVDVAVAGFELGLLSGKQARYPLSNNLSGKENSSLKDSL